MKKKPVTTIDPIDIALAEAKDDSLSHSLLGWQIHLVAAQLSEIRIKRLLWGGVVAVMMGLTILLAVAMVNASRSHALIVEPFHVPASLEARGLDGTTIANRLTDRFAVMRDMSDSSRAEDSYANGGDGDIKIAIPNTGVSVGDVWRYLREWLGHDRRIGGDVTIVGDEVEITARITGGNGTSFRAPLADPTPAIDAAAASIFKQTQPYRYALMVSKTQGMEKSLLLLREIAEQSEVVSERQWGYVGWSASLTRQGLYDEAALRANQGIALDPSFGKIYSNLSDSYILMGRSEPVVAANRKVLALLRTPAQSRLSPTGFDHTRDRVQSDLDEVLRNDQDKVAALQHQGTLREYNGNARTARMMTLVALSRLGEFQRVAASLPLMSFGDPAFSATAWGVAAEFAAETGRADKSVVMIERELAAFASQLPKGKALAVIAPTTIARYVEMLVAAGRTADAATAIAPTRLDCYPCLVARGEVAAAQRDVPAATRWFAEAARQGPSLPQADFQWGRMLAANDNRPAALAHFAVAAKRAPGWYEPPYASGRLLIEAHLFGEARTQLAKAHAAAPKRADVALALGRAQWLGGDRAAAKATWAAARGLDLLAPDIAWLRRIDAAVRRAA